MLRTIIISPDAVLAANLQQVLQEFKTDLTVCRVLDDYPDSVDLARVLRAHAPGVVFLSFQDPVKAGGVAKALCAEVPGLQIVAVHRVFDPALLRESMRAGIREFLTPPFEGLTVSRALGNVMQGLESHPARYVDAREFLTFLPAKAGVGATSLALNIAAALSLDEEKGRVFLGDLDLNSGTLRFLLRLFGNLPGVEEKPSLVDAALQSESLDERNWPGFVTPFGNLDVSHAGHVNPAVRLDHSQLATLLQFLRRNYRAVCFDLSGNLEGYSIEVMQEARNVVLVCTPEIPTLHLAREKMTFLKTLGLQDRVLVVVNRMTRHPSFSKAHVEDLLGAPVFASFSNNYEAFAEAARLGMPLDMESPIGRDCVAFADKLQKKVAAVTQERLPKFLRHFTLPKGSATGVVN